MACIDKCYCGRSKKCEETKCFTCTQLDTFGVATTGTCKTHNTFFTIPGGSCSKCTPIVVDKQFETDCKKTEILEQKSSRLNTGKVQLREIDPDFITGLGEVLTASRQKYEEGNWMKDTKFSTPYESCMRHMMKFWNGDELDEETKKHHLLHAATNLMFLYYHTNSGVGIDDRLFKKKK